MIDAADRPVPRFPSDREAAAADWIHAQIAAIVASGPPARGFSSGARGTDILFLEACRGLAVETTIVLPFAPATFVRTSVALAGRDWERRFHALWDQTPATHREVLGLPVSDAAYAACNLRLVELARPYQVIRIVALWDGKRGDGEGGTEHLINEARKLRAAVSSIAPLDLSNSSTTGKQHA